MKQAVFTSKFRNRVRHRLCHFLRRVATMVHRSLSHRLVNSLGLVVHLDGAAALLGQSLCRRRGTNLQISVAQLFFKWDHGKYPFRSINEVGVQSLQSQTAKKACICGRMAAKAHDRPQKQCAFDDACLRNHTHRLCSLGRCHSHSNARRPSRSSLRSKGAFYGIFFACSVWTTTTVSGPVKASCSVSPSASTRSRSWRRGYGFSHGEDVTEAMLPCGET